MTINRKQFLTKALFASSLLALSLTASAQVSSSSATKGTSKMQKVEFHIQNHGVITMELDAEKAPKTVANFVQYVKDGHYDGTIFHRIIDNFMIQGGGFDANMNQKPTRATIDNEANNGLKNDKYTVAMARTSAPHSASAQFFINNGSGNSFLNFRSPTQDGWGYAVFGKVTGGTEIVDKLSKVATGSKNGHGDVPRENVLVTKAVVL
jgi:peptidyl-prolyl cis-trans isomerase B (cyclophilin B)